MALARHAMPELTPPRGVERLSEVRVGIEARLLESFLDRVRRQPIDDAQEQDERLVSVQGRVGDLLDSWHRVIEDYHAAEATVQYQRYEAPPARPLLSDMLEGDFESPHHRKFRANRSLRDVEPDVNLFLKDFSGADVEGGA